MTMLSREEQLRRIQLNTQANIDRKCAAMLEDACRGKTDSGYLIRGVVTRYTCSCGERRFNDGTRCKCGRYYVAMMNQEDDDRV